MDSVKDALHPIVASAYCKDMRRFGGPGRKKKDVRRGNAQET